MVTRFILSDYVEQALANAVYGELEDNTFAGRIPPCKGVLAFRPTMRECEDELRSTLEDWILAAIELGHALSMIADIDLNKEPAHKPVGAVKTSRVYYPPVAKTRF